jgi:patatin-related protein
MTFDKPSPVTELTQELRLATTMTGGVSLAIWMAGVAREINLLSQASQWRRLGGPFPTNSTLSKESASSLRLYAELIDLLDMVVDVDILSGTSAGGINAALLASSRVSGSDLGGLRNLWLRIGALTDLIRDPRDKNTPSLLYGDERMFAELAEQIPQLKPGPFPPAVFPEHRRKRPTTVYITTTLLTGETSRFTDSFGTLVQDVDRHGLFTFTETELAKRDVAPALALAARSSASFPVAFEPSFIPFEQGTPEKGDVPARPAMGSFANITRPHWAADGGLLDNQPLDVLLKRVFDRPARRPVRRVLLFVVPSSGPAPDLVKEAPPDEVDKPLGLVEGLLKDMAALRSQSISADLRAIRTHQDRMEARTNTRLRLAEIAATLPGGARILTPSLLTDYATREATKLAQDLTSALLRQLSTWPPAPSTSIECIPKNWESDLSLGGDAETACRQSIREAALSRWSRPADQPLPESTADLAHYGHAALDLAKGFALSIVQAAYQLATSKADIAELSELTQKIHQACPPPETTDVGRLVRDVCTNPGLRRGSLQNAAAQLARDHLRESAVPEQAWGNFGDIFVNGYPTLTRLAAKPSSATERSDSLRGREHKASSQLTTYLNYLGVQVDSQTIATKLFDIAATQRALLPAEADVEQSLELVQVSADTRSLLAPDWRTAEQKLTGMQFHHFGAFYKDSWRANDWMWGRLDGAGWLVHVILDPRRVLRVVQAREGDEASEKGTQWFLRRLKALGAPEFPSMGYRLPAAAGGESDEQLTESMVVKELEFLNDPEVPIPSSIPHTSLWLAQAWQQRVLDDELDGLANAVICPGQQQRDWSPDTSLAWAAKVLAATSGAAKYPLLNEDPVAKETFATDKRSPLMTRTITKAAATASAAVGSVRQVPGALKPPVTALRTVALSGYQVAALTKGIARRSITWGAMLLVLGVILAMQNSTWFGASGLAMAGTGACLVVLGTWQCSSRLLFVIPSVTLVGAFFSLACPVVRRYLFGTANKSGWIGAHVYWLGAQWWHPFVVVLAFALALALIAAARPGRWIDERISARISAAKRRLARWSIRHRRGPTPDPPPRR